MRISVCQHLVGSAEVFDIDTDIVPEFGPHRSQKFDAFLFDPAGPAGLPSGIHPGGEPAEG
jgi:hypothetical protein